MNQQDRFNDLLNRLIHEVLNNGVNGDLQELEAQLQKMYSKALKKGEER